MTTWINSTPHRPRAWGRAERLLGFAVVAGGLLLLLYSKPSSRHVGTLLLHAQPSGTGSHSLADQQQLEEAYGQWLSTFTAADAAYQEYCEAVLHNSTLFHEKGGQANQDIFLFQNLYKYWPQQGRKGFYVESGANDPLYLSTSLFFEKCLGWDGLCVEPQEKFHKGLREKRSCTLVPECISAKKETMTMAGTDATARVTAGGSGPTITCAPLSDLLARYAGSAQKEVDLWILDVEGYEMQVLAGTDFSEVAVQAMLVEDLFLMPKPDILDIRLAQQGFLKYQELAVDSVFVRRGHPAAMDTRPLWYPPGFTEEIQERRQFVLTHMGGVLAPHWRKGTEPA